MCNQFNQSTPINYGHIICNFLLKLHIFSCNLATETPLNIDLISFAYYITLITYIETCLYFRYWKGGEKTHEVRGTIEFSSKCQRIQWKNICYYSKRARTCHPAISCVRDQDASTAPARHMWETGSLNWTQFMLQWIMWFPEFAEFSEFLFHLSKTPMESLVSLTFEPCRGSRNR